MVVKTMRRSGPLASLAFGVILAACLAPPVPDGPPMACTLIGCESQVVFELSRDLSRGTAYEIEACVDGECASETIDVPQSGFGTSGPFTVDAHRIVVTVRLTVDDYSGRHTVSLTLVGPDGQLTEVAADTEFERSQPNGPGCEPVCWQAIVRA